MSTLQPIKRVRCTYQDCLASFDTVKEMKSHKKHSAEHDYCSKCDEDFDSYEDFAQHKAFRPDNHGKACRICGDEFKSKSGLNRHIQISHKIDQKLPCIGCGERFHRSSLLIHHLEFGQCPNITAVEFQGHIVHKYLVAELLKGGANFQRLMAKIARFDAAVDEEDQGGISLLDAMDDQASNIDYDAIKPEVSQTSMKSPRAVDPYPPLPSKAGGKTGDDTDSKLASQFKGVSLRGGPESVAASSTIDGRSASTVRASQAWNSGRSASTLFPKTKATPASSESRWSVEQHDRQMEKTEGINILKTRFWDPASRDWNPERFYDTVLQKYYCPFICEQSFDVPTDLNRHIMNDHRITKMRCPSCHDLFPSCYALVAHCESGSKKCKINEAHDFGTFLDRLTGGFLAVQEAVRPDHLHNPAVLVNDPATGRIERYRPPTATYLKYLVTKPVDWTDPQEKATYTIGRQHADIGYLN